MCFEKLELVISVSFMIDNMYNNNFKSSLAVKCERVKQLV